MQPKGFTLSVMCALTVTDVHDELADLHVAFAAAEIVVVVLVADLGDRRPCPAGGSRRGRAACANVWKSDAERRRSARAHRRELLGDAERVRAPPSPYLPSSAPRRSARSLRVVARLPDRVEEPRGDELDVGLGALALEEALELVVAVALGRHRPELADDADLRLRAACLSTLTLVEDRLALARARRRCSSCSRAPRR